MLGALGVTQASLHSADPGQNGANEISGGSPAYARKAVTFGAAASGSITQSGTDPVFDVPAGATVAFVGYWAGAVFVASDAVTSETYGGQGTYTLENSVLDLNL